MDVNAQITMHTEEFRLNGLVLEELLTGPAGPVARDLSARAIRVESAAKTNASQPHRDGPNSGSAPGGGPAVRTGRLRGSITWRLGTDGLGLYADIGSSVEYAVYVEAIRPFLVPALSAAYG